MKATIVALALGYFTSSLAQASCELTIDRTPCPGKLEVARQPYAGVNPTVEPHPKVKTVEACLREADKAVKIIRSGTLAKKVLMAKFDGKDIGKKEDAKDCVTGK